MEKEDVKVFEDGMDLGDFTTLPAKLEFTDNPNEVYITICEGKFHQVKRMFEKVGCTVTFLRRLRFGELTLDGLQTGEYRSLTEEEIKAPVIKKRFR